MKKAPFILLCLFILIACGPSVTPDQLLGAWKITEAEANLGYPEDQAKATEDEFIGGTFIFNIDGTFSHFVSYSEARGSWQLDGKNLTLTSNNSGTTFTTEYEVESVSDTKLKMRRIYDTGDILFILHKD